MLRENFPIIYNCKCLMRINNFLKMKQYLSDFFLNDEGHFQQWYFDVRYKI